MSSSFSDRTSPSSLPIKVAVILFPGMNCEIESADALKSAGIYSEVFRWNQKLDTLSSYDGFFLPGGWSYEDRVRAGAIAAHDSLMAELKKEAEKGKPIIGVCNGFQILAESGLVPGIDDYNVDFALAPNHNPLISGYYCTWITARITKTRENAFNRYLEDGQVLKLPIAHGEGRFTTADNSLYDSLVKNGQIFFSYSSPEGDIVDEFPINPNGSMMNIAGITNMKGNVLGMMPHPERANWLRQVPGFKGTFEESEKPGPGRALFLSMKHYMEERKG